MTPDAASGREAATSFDDLDENLGSPTSFGFEPSQSSAACSVDVEDEVVGEVSARKQRHGSDAIRPSAIPSSLSGAGRLLRSLVQDCRMRGQDF